MKKVLKVTLITIASVIVALILIVVIAVNVILSDGAIRTIVNDYAEENLTATVVAEKYGVSLVRHFPYVTVSIKGAGLLVPIEGEECDAEEASDEATTAEEPEEGVEAPDSVVTDEICEEEAPVQLYDTLFYVERVDVALNIKSLLKNSLVIGGIFVIAPEANYVVYADGTTNWDIFKETTEEESEDGEATEVASAEDEEAPADLEEAEGDEADESSEEAEESGEENVLESIGIRKLLVDKVNLTYENQMEDLYVAIHGGDFKFSGGAAYQKGMKLAFGLDAESIYMSQGEEVIIKDIPVGIQAIISYIDDTHSLLIDDAELNVSGVDFKFMGSAVADTLAHRAEVNLDYELNMPSFSELLTKVPDTYSEYTKDLTIEGELNCKGTVSGYIGNDVMPVVTGTLRFDGGKVANVKSKGAIEPINLDAEWNIDLNQQGPSEFIVNNFEIGSDVISLDFKGSMKSIFTDPKVRARVRLNADLARFADLLPESAKVEGKVDVDMGFDLRLKALKAGDLGNMKAGGRVTISSLKAELPVDDYTANLNIDDMDLVLGAGGGSLSGISVSNAYENMELATLGGSFGYSGLSVAIGDLHLVMDTLGVAFKSSPLRDTTAVVPVEADFEWRDLLVYDADSVIAISKYLNASASIIPWERDRTLPYVKLAFTSDTLALRKESTRISLGQFKVDVASPCLSREKQMWIPTGYIDFEKFTMLTPIFPLPVLVEKTKFEFDQDQFKLNRAPIRVGVSDMAISGNIKNIWRFLWLDEGVDANLTITSRMLNVNQILMAMERGGEFIEMMRDSIGNSELMSAVDSVANLEAPESGEIPINSVIVIPDKYSLDCKLDIARLLLGKWDVSDVKARLDVEDGVLSVREMSMNSAEADIMLQALYRAETSDEAFAGFAFKMEDVDIERVFELFPSFDTIFPMLESFEGNLNVAIAACGTWDSELNVDMNSLKGGAYIDGTDLVVLDGETFAQIAKMLKFKNRERNMIDSLSVTMVIGDGVVDIYPFLLTMDRYKVALGGKQNLDMSFNYHVSVLKWPLGIKFGLNIYGDFDKMKFKITKAKYKDLLDPVRSESLLSQSINVRNRMSNFFEEVKGDAFAIEKSDEMNELLDMEIGVEPEGDESLESSLNGFGDSDEIEYPEEDLEDEEDAVEASEVTEEDAEEVVEEEIADVEELINEEVSVVEAEVAE